MAGGIYGSTQQNPYPQTPFLDNASKMPTFSWQQYFLNLTNFSSSSNATAGTATLPSNPVGFMNVTINGKQFKVPYYNV